MTLKSRQLEIFGASVFGPPPLGWVHIPLRVGVSALYGKNGVGKTRLLRALRHAMAGVSSEGSLGLLHVRVPDVNNFYEDTWRTGFEAGLRSHLVDARGKLIAQITGWRDDSFSVEDDVARDDAIEFFSDFAADIEGEEFSPTSIGEMVAAHFKQLRFGPHVSLEAETLDVVTEEISESGFFTLLADGVPERPGWRVFAAGNAEMPRFAQLVGMDREFYDGLRNFAGGASSRLAEDLEVLNSIMGLSSGFPWGDVQPFGVDIVAGLRPGQDGVATPAKEAWPEPWPTWVTMPALEVGRIDEIPIRLVADTSDPDETDLATRDLLLKTSGGRVVNIATNEELDLTPELDRTVAQLNDISNELLAGLLRPAPSLRLTIGTPTDWFAGHPPTWQMKDQDSDGWFSLHEASAAQVRWASLAIAAASEVSDPDGRPVILLCDEPEAGLHGAIEERLPAALSRMAVKLNAAVVAATHSAHMLDERSVDPMHVTRMQGNTVTRSMPPAVGDALDRALAAEELGISASSLLQKVRCFVAVEGAHDKIVLDHLIGRELREMRASVMPIGGAIAAPSLAEAALLFDFTDAQIVVVLDGVAAKAITPSWQAAIAHADDGNIRQARRELLALEKISGWEAKWLRDLLERALNTGRWNRITPAPLVEPDIICYLPPDAFVSGKTWTDLLQEWRAFSAPARPKDLKGWLADKYNVKVSKRMVESALTGAVPHHDLLALAETIRSASGQ